MNVIYQAYVCPPSFPSNLRLICTMQYLGPSPTQLIFLFVISIVNSTTLFALSVLLVRNIWTLGANVSTIEGWEIERHETLLRRAKVLGGYLDGPDGIKVKITRQEYPYDIGIYQNFKQGMGGSFIFWLWPFAATPSIESGLEFETNGFEGKSRLNSPATLLSSWPQILLNHGRLRTQIVCRGYQ